MDVRTVVAGSAPWTASETRTLQQALEKYPAGQHVNLTRYVKIASMLRGKTVRDVAARVLAIEKAQAPTQSRADGVASASAPATSVTTAPSSDTTGRAAPLSSLPPHMRTGPGSMAVGTAGATPTPGMSPLPEGLKHVQEPMIQSLLAENSELMARMNRNLKDGRPKDNLPLMCKFRDNTHLVLDWLASTSHIMPPLPVELNTVFMPPSPRNVYRGPGSLTPRASPAHQGTTTAAFFGRMPLASPIMSPAAQMARMGSRGVAAAGASPFSPHATGGAGAMASPRFAVAQQQMQAWQLQQLQARQQLHSQQVAAAGRARAEGSKES